MSLVVSGAHISLCLASFITLYFFFPLEYHPSLFPSFYCPFLFFLFILSYFCSSVAEIKSNAPFQRGLCLARPPSLLSHSVLSSLTAFYLFVSVSVFSTSHRHFSSYPHCAFPACHAGFSIDQQE